MLIPAATEETRLYLFNAYELFSFNFVLLVSEKTLVITSNLTNPESASESIINKKKPFKTNETKKYKLLLVRIFFFFHGTNAS